MTETLADGTPPSTCAPAKTCVCTSPPCAEEDPGDGSLLRAALNDVARAGNMAGLARKAGMSREGVYKALSPTGNPSFNTVMRITRALGLQLRIG